MAKRCYFVLLLLLTLSISSPQSNSQLTLDDERNAINSLIRARDWSTLEALSTLGIKYQRAEQRELINHHYYLGISLYEQGRVKDAASYFEEAVKVTPLSAQVWGSLGEAR